MAVTANVRIDFSIDEQIALGYELASSPTIKHSLSTPKTKLAADTTPPLTKVWSDQRALTAGADALDLTALVAPNTALNQNFTGLKVQAIAIQALPTNAGALTFEPAESNGYSLAGTGGVLVVPPGGAAYFLLNDKLGDVGSDAKAVDVSGTGTDGYKIILAAG